MKRENVNYLAVGVFMLTMLIMFMIVIYRITGRTGPMDSYYVFLENVAGLNHGTAVFYEGFKVGQVEDITPDQSAGQTRYRLEITLPSGWQVPSDSVARALSSGLLSAVSIDIKEGESKTYLQGGDTLKGEQSTSLVNAFDQFGADFKDLSDKGVRPLLANVNQLVGDLSRLVDESGPATLGEVKALLAKLNNAAEGLQDVLNAKNRENAAAFLTNMRTTSEDTVSVAERARVAAERLATLTADLQSTKTRLDHILENADGFVTENRPHMEATFVSLRHSLNVVDKHIDTIAHNLENTSRNLNEFSRQIRQNPSLLLNSSPPKDQARVAR